MARRAHCREGALAKRHHIHFTRRPDRGDYGEARSPFIEDERVETTAVMAQVITGPEDQNCNHDDEPKRRWKNPFLRLGFFGPQHGRMAWRCLCTFLFPKNE